MNLDLILSDFEKTKDISDEILNLIQSQDELRKSLFDYFLTNKNREFALLLLDKFVEIRKKPEGGMPAEDLMFACYLLGMNNDIADSIKIWNAKRTDFDSLCAVDIQLVMFSGLNETKKFLKSQKTDDSIDALNYIIECEESGDFDLLKDYFDKKSLPWFV
ncbi:hypothetical protein [Aquimarina longa]|uniref:hypothetical protein n=1 Tax=Aquimarina longa TaxID=1080221 RepID=UPI0007848BBB|nr:hypothetical protein [Aquimarina longa]